MIESDIMETESNEFEVIEVFNHAIYETTFGKGSLIVSIVALGVVALDIVIATTKGIDMPSTSIWGGIGSAAYIVSAILIKIAHKKKKVLDELIKNEEIIETFELTHDKTDSQGGLSL